MITGRLSTAELEETYDLIAAGVDAAGPEKASLFLAKLSLALAAISGDMAVVRDAVDAAKRDL